METNFIVPFSRIDLSGSSMGHKEKVDQNSMVFSEVFKTAIDNVQETNKIESKGALAVATGDVDALHEITIASTQAELALKLFVQLRNKGHEAYSEIMRMGI